MGVGSDNRPYATQSDGTSQDDETTFISGIDASGNVARGTFATWNETNTSDGSGNYHTDYANEFKWGGNNTSNSSPTTTGTSGGTVTYYFDPGANWTSTEETALTSGLDMWSAVANVSFSLASTASAANITFTRDDLSGTGAKSAYFEPTSYSITPGTNFGQKTLYHPGSGSKINIDAGENTNVGFGRIGQFSDDTGGYGVQVTLHEIGHSLGLGHGGPYNGNKVANQQFSPYDNRAYSIMSYFDPNPTNASDNQYASPTTTNWHGQNATTWMPTDIDAIQRLYGAQTSGPLNQSQTFGYNTTITGTLQPYFNFSVNTKPVITLYDTAINGSKLDLSGDMSNETLNLNAGTYSSTNGLTNNIAIYKSTYIQSLVCGAGDDVCTVSTTANNTIDGGSGRNTAIFSKPSSAYTVRQGESSQTVTDNSTGVVTTLIQVQSLQFAADCFTTATLIRTARGDVPVEHLRADDLAVTASGALRSIAWIGRRDLDGAGRPLPHDQQPIRIRAGAFGRDATGRPMPARSLRLSQGHPVLVGADADNEGGALVPVMCLINGTSIAREPVSRLTYWHVELDAHDILLAEGLPAESYFDMGSRGWFSGEDAPLGDPDFVPAGACGRCRPVAADGPLVDAERLRLDAVFAAELARQSSWDAAEAWLAA